MIDQGLPVDYSNFSDDPFAAALFHAIQGSMSLIRNLAVQNAMKVEEATSSNQRRAEAYKVSISPSTLKGNQGTPFY